MTTDSKTKTVTLSVPFQIPNNGYSLRWGETFEQESKGVIELGGPQTVTMGWNVYWELLVGNVLDYPRSTLVHWQITGSKLGVDERTTTAYPPMKHTRYANTAIKDTVDLPGLGGTVDREESEPDLTRGEYSMWIPIGYFTIKKKVRCTVTLPDGNLTLDREEIVLENLDDAAWEEKDRVRTTISHGDTSLDYAEEIIMQESLKPGEKEGPNIKPKKRKEMKLKFTSPIFPEEVDRSGNKFRKVADFYEESRLETSVDTEGMVAQTMNQIIFVSDDGSSKFRLNFQNPDGKVFLAPGNRDSENREPAKRKNDKKAQMQEHDFQSYFQKYFDIGYQAGRARAQKSPRGQEETEKYTAGFDEGFEIGRNIGYNQGYGEGFRLAVTKKTVEIEVKGEMKKEEIEYVPYQIKDGIVTGFNQGYQRGESVGWGENSFTNDGAVGVGVGGADGKAIGFIVGFSDGFSVRHG